MQEGKLDRAQFGRGIAGESAFKLIASGVICDTEATLGRKCGNMASMTVDFDIPRLNDLIQIPVCEEHAQLVEEKIIIDFGESRSASLGRNGRGRS